MLRFEPGWSGGENRRQLRGKLNEYLLNDYLIKNSDKNSRGPYGTPLTKCDHLFISYLPTI